MAKFCTACGAQADDNAVACPVCGAPFGAPQQAMPQQQMAQPMPGAQPMPQQQMAQPMPGAQQGYQIDKAMCILSYFGILCLIPFFSKKEDQYIQFHAKQGLNLFLIEIIAGFALGFISGLTGLNFLMTIANLLSTLCLVLEIVGMVNACKGKMEPLPVVGGIKIIK